MNSFIFSYSSLVRYLLHFLLIFNLKKVEGEDLKHTEVIIEPQVGKMKSKSLLEFKVRIKPGKVGEFSDLRIPCYVSDMQEPIFLSISGHVHGVSVSYFVSNDSDFE